MGTAILVQPTRFSLKPGNGSPSGPEIPKISLERFQNLRVFKPDDDRLNAAVSRCVCGHGDRVGARHLLSVLRTQARHRTIANCSLIQCSRLSPALLGWPWLCEAVAPLAQAALRRTWRPGLCELQGDFASEPFGAPIKTHLIPELANHSFHNACAEPAVRGRREGRPTRLDPAQAEPSVCRKGPCDFNATTCCR